MKACTTCGWVFKGSTQNNGTALPVARKEISRPKKKVEQKEGLSSEEDSSEHSSEELSLSESEKLMRSLREQMEKLEAENKKKKEKNKEKKEKEKKEKEKKEKEKKKKSAKRSKKYDTSSDDTTSSDEEEEKLMKQSKKKSKKKLEKKLKKFDSSSDDTISSDEEEGKLTKRTKKKSKKKSKKSKKEEISSEDDTASSGEREKATETSKNGSMEKSKKEQASLEDVPASASEEKPQENEHSAGGAVSDLRQREDESGEEFMRRVLKSRGLTVIAEAATGGQAPTLDGHGQQSDFPPLPGKSKETSFADAARNGGPPSLAGPGIPVLPNPPCSPDNQQAWPQDWNSLGQINIGTWRTKAVEKRVSSVPDARDTATELKDAATVSGAML
ncbi:hypothetical protein LTR90_002578 [Exophiala xenobiotica]|nr:hypothetical protein LTR90_002578 [Exophiala xenobiotica]KAK5438815.1 hypothetical protein LTR18_008250 [Exophiala xenobiotica]